MSSLTQDADYAYRASGALSNDPLVLVVTLYDMLLKDVHEALTALRDGEIERRANAMRHSFLVLQQLQTHLDMDRGGIVAANLNRFYDYIRAKLLEAQIKADPKIFEQQRIFIVSIRDAWEQLRNQQALPANVAVDAASAEFPVHATPAPTAAEWTA